MPAHRGPDLAEDRHLDKYDYVGFMEKITLGGGGGGSGDGDGERQGEQAGQVRDRKENVPVVRNGHG